MGTSKVAKTITLYRQFGDNPLDKFAQGYNRFVLRVWPYVKQMGQNEIDIFNSSRSAFIGGELEIYALLARYNVPSNDAAIASVDYPTPSHFHPSEKSWQYKARFGRCLKKEQDPLTALLRVAEMSLGPHSPRKYEQDFHAFAQTIAYLKARKH